MSALLAEIQQRHRLTPDAAAAARPATLDDLGATGAAVAALAADLSAVLARLEAAEGDAFSISRVLREVEPDLRRVGQLLAGLGYQEEHEILQPQLERIQSGLVGGADLDDRLTEISAALLDVDQRLAARAVRARGEQDELAESRRHPLQRALAAVYREVQAGLEQVKRTIGDYVSSAADARLARQRPGAPAHSRRRAAPGGPGRGRAGARRMPRPSCRRARGRAGGARQRGDRGPRGRARQRRVLPRAARDRPGAGGTDPGSRA